MTSIQTRENYYLFLSFSAKTFLVSRLLAICYCHVGRGKGKQGTSPDVTIVHMTTYKQMPFSGSLFLMMKHPCRRGPLYFGRVTCDQSHGSAGWSGQWHEAMESLHQHEPSGRRKKTNIHGYLDSQPNVGCHLRSGFVSLSRTLVCCPDFTQCKFFNLRMISENNNTLLFDIASPVNNYPGFCYYIMLFSLLLSVLMIGRHMHTHTHTCEHERELPHHI